MSFIFIPQTASNNDVINTDIDYYVSYLGGSASNDGLTPAAPLNTLAAVNTLLQNKRIDATVTIFLDNDTPDFFFPEILDVFGTGTLIFARYNTGTGNNLLQLTIQAKDSLNVSLLGTAGSITVNNVKSVATSQLIVDTLDINNVLSVNINNTNTISNLNIDRFSVLSTAQGLATTNNVTINNGVAVSWANNLAGTVTFGNITNRVNLANISLDATSSVTINNSFSATFTNVTLTAERTTYAINLDNISIAEFFSNFDLSNFTNSPLISFSDVRAASLECTFRNNAIGSYTRTISPIAVIDTELSVNSTIENAGQFSTVSTVDIFDIQGSSELTLSTLNLSNIPFDGNTGLTSGQIINNTSEADNTIFDPSTSSLTSLTVQDAIEELVSLISAPTSQRQKSISGAIDATVNSTASQDLRHDDGTFYNLVPHAVEFDAEITHVILSNAETTSYTIQVLVDNINVGNFTRNNASTVQVFTLGTPVAVTQGQQIRLRFISGAVNIDRPAAQLIYREV